MKNKTRHSVTFIFSLALSLVSALATPVMASSLGVQSIADTNKAGFRCPESPDAKLAALTQQQPTITPAPQPPVFTGVQGAM